jgi:death on curing protein
VTRFLTTPALIRIAHRACGENVVVRDAGLLESALARPRATVLGQDAYRTIWGKAAALLHSLVANDALVDGNNRLGWQAAVVFLWINGWDVRAPEDDAFDLVVGVASGDIADIEKLAEHLRAWSYQR